MPRGGKRPGAGRKAGQLNKRTIARQQLASRAAEQGITPLDLMLKRMRYYNSVVDRELERGEAADRGIIDGALKAANEAAKDAAPYLHPRLSAVEHTARPDDFFTEMLKLIDGTSRGLPDPAHIPADRDVVDLPPMQPVAEPQTPVEARSPLRVPGPGRGRASVNGRFEAYS